jgi:hypothetical protein
MPEASRILRAPFMCSTRFFPVTQAKATIKLVSAAKKNDLATVQDCRLKSVNIDAKVVRSILPVTQCRIFCLTLGAL